jgi:monoamine oxidase
VYWFKGSYYTRAQLNADWQSWAWSLFNNSVQQAPWPTSYNSYTTQAYNWDHLSVAQWVAQNIPGGTASTFGGLCLQDVIDEYGGDASDQSALNLIYLLGYNDSGNGRGFQSRTSPVLAGTDEKWHAKGGNDQVITGLANQITSGVTINTGYALVKLAKNADLSYTCTFQNGSTAVADHVVLATPFKALRNVDLTQAGLSSLKMTAINNLGMGTSGKVIMQFNSRPWYGLGFTGTTYADNGLDSGWEATNYQAGAQGILVDFLGGVDAVNAINTYGMSQHEGVLPSNAATNYLGLWNQIFPGTQAAYNGLGWYHFGLNDPYVQGGYSYWRVGQYTGFSGYEGVQEGKIHFAGEQTEQDFQGFMEGSARSGLREAKAIIKNP